MAVYTSARAAGAAMTRPVVAIGNFDGVHRGHRDVLARAIARAEAAGTTAAALTFEPHPVRFFRPDAPAFRLTPAQQKHDLLQAAGVDVVALAFDADLASLSPTDFVETILHQGVGASCVLVGADFAFGKGRAGNVEVLRELAGARGIEVEVVPPFRLDGAVVSSTRIREALVQGDLEVVTHLLGRPYAILGRVIHGDARGRELGYPTANVATPNPLLPPDGIYAATMTLLEGTSAGEPAGGCFGAATYIGTRPTFDEDGARTVESFLLDVEGIDLYERPVELAFHARTRPDQRFDSAEALVAQMERDVEQVRRVLAGRG